MILIVTSRGDYTSDFVVLRLTKLGIPFARFNTEDFPRNAECSIFYRSDDSRQTDISLGIGDLGLKMDQVTGIWYRRPGRPSVDQFEMDDSDICWAYRECDAILRGVWEISSDRIVSLPSAIRRAEEKPFQLKVAMEVGLSIPETLISNDPDVIKESINQGGEWISKPLWSGSYPNSKGDLGIWCEDVDDSLLDIQSEELRVAPFILQRKVLKEFDARVIVFKSKAFAFSIHQNSKSNTFTDWRAVDPAQLTYTSYKLPSEVYARCLKVLERLNLQFGAFDFAVLPSGEHIFLEINPNGQWAWLEIETGVDLTGSLIELLSGIGSE